MLYYHIFCMEDHGFTIDDLWSDRWSAHYFCEECGVRLPGVQRVSIRLTCDRICRTKILGAFGLWDIGFAHERLLTALGLNLNDYFYFGLVRGANGRVIPGMRTFCSRGRRVPIRGFEPATERPCRTCGRLNVVAMGLSDHYIVARVPLTSPIYESNIAQLVLREDVFTRVKNMLPRNVVVEQLRFEPQGHDGRREPELEWRGLVP